MAQHNTIPCTVDGCSRLAWARALCRVHYNAWRRKNGPTPCAVEGCTERSYAFGHCSIHHRRIQQHGSPHIVLPFRPHQKPLIDRFWSFVEKTPTCWLWTGTLAANGYGHLSTGKHGYIIAHRFSWELENGPWPKGRISRHTCDVRRCVRPSHIIPGTTKENSEDMVARGRSLRGDRNPSKTCPNLARGTENYNAKLTETQVRDAVALSQHTPVARIAQMMGVYPSTIHRIIKGTGWKHLQAAQVTENEPVSLRSIADSDI